MKTFLPIFLLLLSFIVVGQSNQAEYLEAKRQYSLGNYATAQRSFQGLANDPVFKEYASFYYALTALKQGNAKEAYDMWKQIQQKYPSWDQQGEVSYWLGYTAFAQGKHWEGFNHIENLPKPLKESLIVNEFAEMPLEGLEKVYALNPDNLYIGSYLMKAIMRQPYIERDQRLLAELSDKVGVEVAVQEMDLPFVKKERYSIAAVLPFMFDSLGNPQSVIRNSIIFDMYMGMLEAKEDLEQDSIFLDIFPYDTKKKLDKTQEIIDDGHLANADVIVGPLYGGPNQVISNYSQEQKITMVNPLSSNEQIIGDNPYSFLFKPSYAAQGRAAAEYAKKTFTENKLACIYYETKRDSLIADAYMKAIEADSFFIVRFERLLSDNGLQVQRDFTDTYEVRLDTLFSEEQIDSIGLIPGRIVKTRPLRDEDDGSIIKDRDGEDVLEYYENRFTIPEDSIGHFFVATNSNHLANNFISLKEVRIDTIGLMGYESWLDFTLMSFEQLERLKVAMIHPSFVNKEVNMAVIDTLKTELGKEPSEYHLTGYELVMQLGKLFQVHGKYFQRGLMSGEFIPGLLADGMRYGPYNDNQVVPITLLEDLRLKNYNSEKDKDRVDKE